MALNGLFDARTRWGVLLPVVCIVIVGLFLTLGTALRAQSERSASLRQAASIQADNLARLIETRIEQDGAAIERMGARITARNAPISEAEWRADAAAYLHDKAWLEALYWVDADGVRWAEPQDAPAITAVIGGRAQFGDDRAEAGPTANRLNIGATVQYAEGRPGLVGYYTFARPESGVGVLVTIHDVVTMLQLAERAAHASGHDLALTVPGSSAPLVGHSDTVAGRQGVAAVAPIGVYDVNWRLHIAPSEVLLAGFRRYAVLGNVLAGLALTAMGATLAFLVQNARRQTAELEAAQETRQISEQRYNLVVRGMAIGVWDWDIPANSLDWSPNALRILGLGPDHEIGDADFFFDRVHPDDVGMMQEAIQRHFEHNEPYAPDFRIRHKDGHYVWCHATGQAILDEAGNPVRMAGSIQDITADRAINEARRKSEQRLRAITQSAVDAVLTTNAKGIIEQANPACEYIFGYRPDELVGSNIRFLTPTEHRRKHDYYIRHYIETGDSDIVGKVREVEGIHKDGHVIPIELAVTEYKAGDDRIFIATARDLTARKHAEAERENFIARLEETNAELERFNFAASHDLREPLRMIGNFSQLLLKNYREELDDDGRRALEICAGSAQRMQALLDDLISFSRASDDLGQIEAFMPAGMIELAQQYLSDAMAASQATVHTVHLPGSFRANPTRFSRVFQNLISNSIKYAPDGETPRIQISAAPYEQGWLFTLSDNGIGMKPEYCEQIFEPFKRLHPASKYSGTGMGLAICRKIVNGAGGRIWAESQPGKGSRFYVYWPERQETDASVPANRQDEANGPAPAQHGEQA